MKSRVRTSLVNSAWRPRPVALPSSRHVTSTSGTVPGATPSAAPRRSFWAYSSLVTTGILSGLALSLYLPRPRILQILYPVPTPVPHPADSDLGRQETARLEAQLQQLEPVKRLRAEMISQADLPKDANEDAETTTPAPQSTLEAAASAVSNAVTNDLVPKWTESRPYAATPPGPHSLSGYTLRGPGKFALPPLVFTSRDKRDAVFFVHIGNGLCGHEGITHGGLLGTLLDESMGRTALLALPTNIGVTATLELAYRKPTFANQFVVIKTELVEVKGRKARVQGRIEDLDGQVLVEAKALFVEPKMARFLDNSSVREALK